MGVYGRAATTTPTARNLGAASFPNPVEPADPGGPNSGRVDPATNAFHRTRRRTVSPRLETLTQRDRKGPAAGLTDALGDAPLSKALRRVSTTRVVDRLRHQHRQLFGFWGLVSGGFFSLIGRLGDSALSVMAAIAQSGFRTPSWPGFHLASTSTSSTQPLETNAAALLGLIWLVVQQPLRCADGAPGAAVIPNDMSRSPPIWQQ